MEEPESYIERIHRLADRNKELKNQLDELVKRFTSIEMQNKQYQDIVSKYAQEPEEKVRDARKNAKRLRMVSVLYISVHGFEELYRLEDPSPMVDLLDELYLALEEIAFIYNVVKIKSVGDVMIFAAGLQGENRTNPIDIVRVALEMQQAVEKLKAPDGKQFWRLKMGIHTGPVVAIPGGNSAQGYSFSGDSINIACRLGEACPASSISTSVMTYELIKEFFDSSLIGKMPVKYKGNLGMYNISGYRPELQSSESDLIPNHKFKVQYLTLKFLDIQEELLDYLESKLPENLYYHNIKHTIDVITEVELIGWAEGVSISE